jgi:hypothetical protein
MNRKPDFHYNTGMRRSLHVLVSRFSYIFDLERAANITWYWRRKTTVRDCLTKDDWHGKKYTLLAFLNIFHANWKKNLETGC